MIELIPLVMFGVICVVLLAGFPVAFSLAGTALIFSGIGIMTNTFDGSLLGTIPNRLYGDMTNMTLVAVPLFIFMGVLLEKSNLAQDLLGNMADLMGGFKGSLAISVIFVGALIAASTGIVGATVIAMGLISLPIMLQRNYDQSLAAGTICATETLGQIIPPSIALVILGDVLSASYQQSQLSIGWMGTNPIDPLCLNFLSKSQSSGPDRVSSNPPIILNSSIWKKRAPSTTVPL